MKWLVYTLFAVAFLLITFFGLGPVLLADGTTAERMGTLLAVIVLYLLLFFLFIVYLKRKK